MPIFFRHLYPKLKQKDYLRYKNNPDFGNKKALVCDDCYLTITKQNECIGAVKPEP